MRTKLASLIVAVVLVVGAHTASAQDPAAGGGGRGNGFGVGVEAMLAGAAGPTFVYQASVFHIAVIFAFDTGVDENFLTSDDEVEVGGRFFYEIHSGEISDFSVGGGVGIDDDENEGGMDDDLDVHLEAAAQIRAFIVPNVAIHSSFGLALELDDDGADDDLEIAFTGQLLATVGITYFFF